MGGPLTVILSRVGAEPLEPVVTVCFSAAAPVRIPAPVSRGQSPSKADAAALSWHPARLSLPEFKPGRDKQKLFILTKSCQV